MFAPPFLRVLRARVAAWCLLAALVPVSAAVPNAAGDELLTALAGLEAPAAAERFAAERWLVANLSAEAAPSLVAALDSAQGRDLGEEAIWRLGRALGARPENLGLALELVTGGLEPTREVGLEIEPPAGTDDEPGSALGWSLGRRLGRLALDQEIASWRAGLDRQPLSGAALVLRLREERERHTWTRLEIADGPVADVVIRIAREGNLPVPVALSQGLAEKLASERFGGPTAERVAPFRGPWDVLLVDFARSHGLAWEAVLFRGEVDDEIAWLRLVPRGEEGVESGAAQLTRALEDTARRRAVEDPDGRASVSAAELQLAARFLASVEWDAATNWLGDLLERDLDGMARVALLEAAARGRLEPRLGTAAGVESLLKYARSVARPSDAGAVHLDRLGAAFERFPRAGADGADLGALFAAGWREDWDAGRVAVCGLRLAGLAGTETVSEASLALARTVLVESRGHGLEIWRALAVLALDGGPATGAPALELGDPEALFALLPDVVAPDELARRLAAARVRLPFEGSTTSALSPATVRTLFLARVFGGDFEAAANLLVEPTAEGGLGFGESGSWARSREAGRRGRCFDELCEAVEGLMRRGELVAVRTTLDTARRRAVLAIEAQTAPTDLSGLTRGLELAALARLELLGGAMAPAQQALLSESLDEAGKGSPIADDAPALGMLAAGPRPAANGPRERLLDLFAAALASPRQDVGADVLPAIERCLEALWARSADAEAEALILDVATVAAGDSQHPLAQVVLFRAWPPSPR